MKRLRVLLTNMGLVGRSGTETYVRDLALELFKQGCAPMVYSPRLGDIAEEIRQAGIPVAKELAQITITPDVIHGHHYVPTLAALLHFPETPGIFVCHDRLAWHDQPPIFPRIIKYLAVDENCRDRLTAENGISLAKTQVVFNAVDLNRFLPRAKLPKVPKRALVFSNYVNERNYLPQLRQACEIAEIELEVLGEQVGKLSHQPEQVLPHYDLVFAKARCALEAMACGCAVILCDARGLGGLVTQSKLADFQQYNFGFRLLNRPITVETVLEEIYLFDPLESEAVCQSIRATAGLDRLAQQMMEVYAEAIATSKIQPGCDLSTESSFVNALNYLETQIWENRFWQETSEKRLQLIQQLTETAEERLQLIQQLTKTAEERLQLIQQLTETAEERLQLIQQLTAALNHNCMS